MSQLSVVTGGLGFTGSHLVEVLHQKGHRVRVLDLPFEGDAKEELRKGRYLSVARKCKAEFVPCDLREIDSLKGHLEDADYVFHLAALFDYTAPMDLLIQVNVNGTENLCKLLQKNRKLKRLVIWGSGAVYGIPKKEDLPLTEDAPIRPVTRYGESKRLEEEIAEKYYARGMPVTWLRPSAVYGPRDTRVFYELFRMIKQTPVLFLPENFNFPIPFVHARDVARAALHLSEKPDAVGEIYNIDDNSNLTYDQVVKMLARRWDKLVIPLPAVPLHLLRDGLFRLADLENRIARWLARKPRLPRDLVLFLGHEIRYSNEKLIRTGFQFHYGTLEKGLDETLHWYTEHALL